MSAQEELNQDFRRRERQNLMRKRQIVVPFLLLIVICMVAGGTYAYWTTRALDHQELHQTQHLAQSAIDFKLEELRNWNYDYAAWDETIAHVITVLDRDWANNNIGAYLYDSFGIDRSYVVAADDRTLIAYRQGNERPSADLLSDFPPHIATLLENTRASSPQAPQPASGIFLQDGEVLLVSASVITPENPGPEVRSDQPRPVLVLTRSLNEELLAKLAERFLLPGLRLIQAGSQDAPATLPLRDPAEKILGELSWDLEAPGSLLARKLLPIFPFVLLVIVLLTRQCLSLMNRFWQEKLATEHAYTKSVEQMFKLNHFDPLTSLPNRHLFCDRLEQACKQTTRSGLKGAVMLLDLDRFKRINNSFDRLTGDYLLTQVGERLCHCLRDSDTIAHFDAEKDNPTIARLGGDEFSILLREAQHIQNVGKVAQRLLQALKAPFLLASGQEITLSASIGIAIFPDDGHESEGLLQLAEVAMRHAKQQGRDCYQFYTKEMNATALQRLLLENDIRQGLERGEFVLHYQPQIDLSDGRIVSVEALARWQHPVKGLVSPAVFMPVAFETGLVDNLVAWTLETACAQMRDWLAMDLTNLRVAVNVPSRQFLHDDIPAKIQALLERYALDGRCLELEITEESVMSEEEKSIETLTALKRLDIELSIDDFGTGYSSLSYLSRFPLDTLKVDRSFIQGVPNGRDNCTLVRAIISMAQSLGLNVVAEGVETLEQLEFIRATNCEKIQGFYFSKALPVDEINRLLLGEVELPPFHLIEKSLERSRTCIEESAEHR